MINAYVLFCLKFKELVMSLQPDVQLRWNLNQNVAFNMDKWLKLKNHSWMLLTCDSIFLIVSQMLRWINQIKMLQNVLIFHL